MNKKELKFILQEGEGFKIEFKEGPGGIDKDMAAFANVKRELGNLVIRDWILGN